MPRTTGSSNADDLPDEAKNATELGDSQPKDDVQPDAPQPDEPQPDGPQPDDATDVRPDATDAQPDDGIAHNDEVQRRWRLHPVARVFFRFVVAVTGVLLGILIGGHTTADIGPMKVSADLLVTSGNTTLRIPPLGALEFDAYDGPIQMQMTVLTVDRAKATAYVNGNKDLNQLTAQLEADLQGALTSLVVKTVIWAVIGGAVASLLLYRRFREGLISVGMAVGLIAVTGVIGYATFDSKALQAPRYTGLLEQAPAIVGNVTNLADKFADYRKSLVKLVTNVSSLYSAVSTLPTGAEVADTTKVLHVSDIHMNPAGFDLVANLVKQFKIDFVIDTGDIVDWGTPQEKVTFSQIGSLGVPYVYVRGNHDSLITQAEVGQYPNVKVLDKNEIEISGITMVGLGDPRFSPDRSTYDNSSLDKAAEKGAKELADYISTLPKKPDIVLYHDPNPAKFLKDSGPLILSGHSHKPSVKSLDKDTLLMVEGSTGGAGLRGLEGDKPTPLTASVLYFDSVTHKLRAWDAITVGGLGQTDVSINRQLAPEAVAAAEESAASITPSEPSATDEPTDSDAPATKSSSDATPSDSPTTTSGG